MLIWDTLKAMAENDLQLQKAKLKQKDIAIEKLSSSEAALKTSLEKTTHPRMYVKNQMEAFKAKEASVYETLVSKSPMTSIITYWERILCVWIQTKLSRILRDSRVLHKTVRYLSL